MKLFIVALLVAAACAARSRGGDDFGLSGDRFDPSGRGSSSGRDRDTSSGDRFPPFFRVEVEIQRLEDKAGVRADGQKCDGLGAGDCDPRVLTYLDANNALAPWPGGKPVKEWTNIFEVSNQNSPTIGKTIVRDVCGGSVSNVNARVRVEDVDVGVTNDLMGQFECKFTVSPRDIARDALSAQWGPSMECTVPAGTQQDRGIKLFARERAYEISSSNCQADASSKSNTDSFNNNAAAKREGEHDFIRLDCEIVQLLDPQSITFKKEKCDSGNACDPGVSAYIDIDKALAAWPGTKTVDQFTPIFSVNNVDSPVINKNISRNICGGALSQVNLRVHVQDADTFSSDLIEDFECVFTADYSRVARDVSSADWSSTQDCKPLHPGHDIRLQFRYRLYDIPAKDCGVKSG